MRLFLFLAFVIVPIVEIALFLSVGSWLGVLPTLGLIVLTAIAGTMLVRSQGLDVLAKLRAAAEGNHPLGDTLAQGACILIAGLLLLTPGFATDAFGFALLIPPVRGALTSWLWKIIKPHIHVVNPADFSGPGSTGSAHYESHETVIIEGEAVEVDDEAPSSRRFPTNN